MSTRLTAHTAVVQYPLTGRPRPSCIRYFTAGRQAVRCSAEDPSLQQGTVKHKRLVDLSARYLKFTLLSNLGKRSGDPVWLLQLACSVNQCCKPLCRLLSGCACRLSLCSTALCAQPCTCWLGNMGWSCSRRDTLHHRSVPVYSPHCGSCYFNMLCFIVPCVCCLLSGMRVESMTQLATNPLQL